MQNTISEVTALTILISTTLILLFGGMIIYFLFLYQNKRFRHQKEVIELREAFNHTLLESKLEIQEQTLDHISKELHANFSHLVSLININLAEILPRATNEMKDNILETKSLAKQLLAELKALSASLNTDHIMRIGFARALENELARMGKLRKYKVELSLSGEEIRLRPEREIILFRLCQEVLNNILQYARATTVTVEVNYTQDFLKLLIADNGIGFNVDLVNSQSAEKESTGLLNIRKRAHLISGEVQITSLEGIGTSVSIVIPVNVNQSSL